MLLRPERFDFMAKFLYVKGYDREYNTDFYRRLYEAHLNTFNGCYELPDSTNTEAGVEKKNIDDFLGAFHSLIKSLKKNGFDKKYSIPVGSDGCIENGTHRLIASYYLKTPISTYTLSSPGQKYDYRFFMNRQGKPSLSPLYADTMALEYVNHQPNLRCMILYPVAFDPSKFQTLFSIIQQYGYIYYHKEVELNAVGVNNLIKELYRGEEWIGGWYPTNGGYGKYRLCYKNNSPILYISIVMNDVTKCIEMKEKCREIYGMAKNSLHVSDFYSDTWRISSSLLNANSIHFLNNTKANMIPNSPKNISKDTELLLMRYFDGMKEDRENCCLSADLVREIYGMGSTTNKPHSFMLNRCNNVCSIDGFLVNNTNTNSRDVDVDDIIYNPENHFYFNGFKFMALHLLD